jgi:hypothetical protein
LCSVTLVSVLADEVIFIRAGDIKIVITIIIAIMAMAQPRTSTLTVMFQDNRETNSLLVLLLG